MRIAFFTSSLGDTDLAKATITRLLEQNSENSIFLIPLGAAASTRTEDLIKANSISRVLLTEIISQPDALSKNKLSDEELEKVMDFIRTNKIQRAYVGVPSTNNEIPFQIASGLEIPCTIAYEFMFKAENHIMWNYVDVLASKANCEFAVSLAAARNNILEINKKAQIFEIGHLSIDRSPMAGNTDSMPIRQLLRVSSENELVFVSGTTQPTEIDNQFLDALLSEISTGKYLNLQLRMGLHPGVKDPDAYLQTLLTTCDKYKKANEQFQIILTSQFEKRLLKPVLDNPFILRVNISGSDAAQAADKVTQAVPGALLNEAAFNGKPSYFHASATPYLPKEWFSKNLSAFFKAKAEAEHSREELGVKESAPELLSRVITK